MNRTMVAVDGASDVLAAAAAATSPHHAAQRLRDLAAQLDLGDAREATIAEGRSVVLASDPSGGALALRWFAPDAPTTTQDHGSWGAAVVLAGRDRYERFEPRNGVAVLDATLWLEAGDIVWWFDPPHNLHRQSGSDGGALELIADVCIPAWRFQIRGRDPVGELLANEEFGLPGQRLESFRAFPCSTAASSRSRVPFNHGDETRRWRDIHLMRRRDGPVTEHLAYCTGHWDAITIARHDSEHPWFGRDRNA